MNFFGHACLAAAENGDARFVLGAMLPDLAPMAGLRIQAIEDDAIAAGHAHHVATDVAFHGAAEFTGWVAEATGALRAAGVRRGPARGIAHVGIELLLDGWLARTRGVPEAYRRALASGLTLGDGVRVRSTPRPGVATGAVAADGPKNGREAPKRTRAGHPAVLEGGFPELCRRIADSPLPAAYGTPAFTAERVVRILGRRPRLATLARERAAIEAWTRHTARGLEQRAPALLAAVESVAL